MSEAVLREGLLLKENEEPINKFRELFEFLQGKVPKGIKIPKRDIPKLTKDQAWYAIWFLQEVTGCLSDRIERCDRCGDLFDKRYEGGFYQDRQYCDICYRIVQAEGEG